MSKYVSKYDQDYLSEEDQKLMDQYKTAYANAAERGDQAGRDAAHAAAEALRSKYNYSGGGDGSQYIGLGKSSSAGNTFTYKEAPSYVSRYQDQIDDLTRQILGREAFSYDPERDPAYQQYKESYTRNGQRAMDDTLGKVSARTGGLASSYAATAAQQTYDGYMSALADKIPELRQLAYSMYLDEGDRQRQDLSLLQGLENTDYGRYADALNQYNSDRNFAYSQYRDGVSDARYDNEWNYNVGRDNISDARYANEWNYNVGRDNISDARYANEWNYGTEQDAADREFNQRKYADSQALTKAETLAAYGDFSGYKALGYSDAEIAQMKAAWDASQRLAASSGYRSSGSWSTESSSGESAGGQGIISTMLGMGTDYDAYEYLVGQKLTNSQTDNLWNMYQTAKQEQTAQQAKENTPPNFSDFKRSVTALLASGQDEKAAEESEKWYGKYSPNQRAELDKLFRQFGYGG